jgi:membrane-bound lytic murein transglycosylase B
MPDPHRPWGHRPRHAAVRVPNPGPSVGSWLPRCVIAVGAAAAIGLLATASGASNAAVDHSAATGQSGSAELPALRSITDLSRGAPPSAKVIPARPVHAAVRAPADPETVSTLAADGIPTVALNAYRVAAARMASADPGCGISWPLLAAIGRVESDHGRYGGAKLLADGTSSIPIIGPALNGVQWDFISDTDRGRLDGDPVYDHAIGPMQFIPSTWAMYGLDANDDGLADPFDINDAALAAARYLCTAGGNLATLAGQERAVLAYNHSDEYLNLVLATAAAYAAGTPVTGPVQGITSGPLPQPAGAFLPPVNPGSAPDAPAAQSSAGRRDARTSRRSTAGDQPAGSGGAAASAGSATGSGTQPTGASGHGPEVSTGPGGSGGSGGAPPMPPVTAPGRPSPTLPVRPAPSSPAGVGGVVSGAVCTVTGLLGNLIPVPCPTR